jgi:hypothetical protein
MSEVRFIANVEDFDQADARAAKLDQTIAQQDRKIKNQEAKVFMYAAAVMHVGNMVANIVARSFAGTEAAFQAQDVAMGINIATTELGIGRMSLEAIEKYIMHDYWAAARLGVTAGLMQVNLIQQTSLQIQARQAARHNRLLRMQIERWR